MFNKVGDFHEKFGLERVPEFFHPLSVLVRTIPPPAVKLDPELIKFRLRFLREELEEIEQGYRDGDLEQVADGLVDLVYVALGTAHLHRLPFNELFSAVHEANMKKVRAQSSADSKRGSFYDVVKPDGWQKPDVAQILKDHGWNPKD